jgi:tetratricopeptide (TPR) repeat protein
VKSSIKNYLVAAFVSFSLWHTGICALATNTWATAICAADTAKKEHKLVEAEKLFAESLRDAEAFEEGDPRLFMSLRGLADVCLERGEREKAEQLYLRQLKIVEKVGYIHRADETYLWSSIAFIASKQGHMVEAERRYRKAISLAEEQNGLNSLEVASLSSALAYCCHHQNHFDDAITANQRALKIHQMLEPNGSFVSDDLAAISCAYQDKHDYLQSDAIEKRALAIRLKLCRSDDPRLVQSLSRLANNMTSEHNPDQALTMYKTKLLNMGAIAYGPNSFQMSILLDGLALAYKEKKDYANAITIYEKALAIQRKVLTKEDRVLGRAVTDLAGCYLKAGKPEKARQVCRDYLRSVSGTHKINDEALSEVMRTLALSRK